MPATTKCTYGDLAKLRDLPGRPGALTKLNQSIPPSVVDGFKIARLVRAADAALREYVSVLVQIGKKYGDPVAGETSGAVNYQIRPDQQAAFDSEIAALHAAECEVAAPPLPVGAYERAGLTPAELDALEKFLILPEGV
jgi:hypothetical protein